MTNEEKLLNEFEEYRWFLMKSLADEAEERSETDLANGWRWLLEHKRYPDNRAGGKYGWLFQGRPQMTPVVMKNSYGRKGVYLTGGQAHKLPSGINEYMPSTANASLPELMKKTARAVGQWLKNQEKTLDL